MNNYKIIDSKGKEITGNVSLHPGEVLQLELEARQLKKSEFAASLNMKASHFSEVLHGKRHVGASMALKLEELLGISAEFWMRVQVSYDLFEARRKATVKNSRSKVKAIPKPLRKKVV